MGETGREEACEEEERGNLVLVLMLGLVLVLALVPVLVLGLVLVLGWEQREQRE